MTSLYLHKIFHSHFRPSPLSQPRRTSVTDSSAGNTSRGFRPGQEVSNRLYPRPANQNTTQGGQSRRELGPVREGKSDL